MARIARDELDGFDIQFLENLLLVRFECCAGFVRRRSYEQARQRLTSPYTGLATGRPAEVDDLLHDTDVMQ